MPKNSMRGIAPGRERDANSRRGSFKRHHPKRGGRRKGTANAFSRDYRQAIIEAAYRIGHDGNGKNGLVGYLMWVAVFHPRAFSLLLGQVVPLEALDRNRLQPADPPPTVDQVDERVRAFLEIEGASPQREKYADVKYHAQNRTRSSADWTGQPFPLSTLMQNAVASPIDFCKLLAAAFLRLPRKRSRLMRPPW